jgi:hypothetical protein
MRPGATTILAAASAVLVTFGVGRAQEAPLSEYRLKAAFLFNFAKFVEWPQQAFAEPKSPIVIGVLGDNPFGTDLEETVRNKLIGARPVVVKEFQATDPATNCHILFISNSEKKRLPEILAPLRGHSVLTVGDTERFIEAGGMINLVPEGNKIRFQINDETARSAKLRISSKLLSLALRPVR